MRPTRKLYDELSIRSGLFSPPSAARLADLTEKLLLDLDPK